jgi:hypothetical protein
MVLSERLARLSGWLRDRDRRFLFELFRIIRAIAVGRTLWEQPVRDMIVDSPSSPSRLTG